MLPRLVGYNAAMELMLTAKFIQAEEARQVSVSTDNLNNESNYFVSRAMRPFLLFLRLAYDCFMHSLFFVLCLLFLRVCLTAQLGLCSAVYPSITELDTASEALAKTIIKTSSRALRVSPTTYTA